jgi:hypothetical protein
VEFHIGMFHEEAADEIVVVPEPVWLHVVRAHEKARILDATGGQHEHPRRDAEPPSVDGGHLDRVDGIGPSVRGQAERTRVEAHSDVGGDFEALTIEPSKAQHGAGLDNLVRQLRGIDVEGLMGEARPTGVEVIEGEGAEAA